MARPEVYDSTAIIAILRSPESDRELSRKLTSGQIWLPSVVVAELYAGTRSHLEAAVLNQINTSLARVGHLLTPNHAEWCLAGRLIGRRARLAGAIRPRDHLADALIVVSAARLGGTIVTANTRHLEVWADLAQSAGLDVTVTPQESL